MALNGLSSRLAVDPGIFGPDGAMAPGRNSLLFPEPVPDSKPFKCVLCPYITESAEELEQHTQQHGKLGLYHGSPPAVKQEPGGEWWPPYEAEDPSLSLDPVGGLGPRGLYGWEFQSGEESERPWVGKEAAAGGKKRNGHLPLGKLGGSGYPASAGGQRGGGGETLLNYKVVVVGEDGKPGERPEPADSLCAEDELTAQQREHFSTVYEAELDGVSGGSSPGSRPHHEHRSSSSGGGGGGGGTGGGQGKQKWQSKQYQCDLCPYVARGKQDLRIHEREEHLKEGSDVIKCNQCNYTTNKISFWRQHKLVHISANGTTGRIYMCKTCGWKTKYRHSLVKHIALHTGNKSFQCDQCGFACARKENLKRHKLTHLKKGVDGKGLMLKCDWCEYATAHSNALRRHAMTLHNADENYIPEYRCDVCDFKTTKLSNFSNHKVTHLYGYMMVHVNQTGPLKCSLCPFVTDHWDCLQEHQRTHTELRCLQDILGGGGGGPGGEETHLLTPGGKDSSSDNDAEAGAPAMRTNQAYQGDAGQSEAEPEPEPEPEAEPEAGFIDEVDRLERNGKSRDDDIVALKKIIGTIGEYINGDEEEEEEDEEEEEEEDEEEEEEEECEDVSLRSSPKCSILDERVTGSEIEYCGTSYREPPAPQGHCPERLPSPPRGVPGSHRPRGAGGGPPGCRSRRADAEPGAAGFQPGKSPGAEEGPRLGGNGKKIPSWRRHKRLLRGVGVGGSGLGVGTLLSCPTCGWQTRSRASLAQHLTKHPAAGKALRCGQCGFGCYKRERMRRHLLTHSHRDPPAHSPLGHNAQGTPQPPEQQEAGVTDPPSGSLLEVERERLALEREKLEFEREKWRAQRALGSLQQQKLQLQVLLLQRQLGLIKPPQAPQT